MNYRRAARGRRGGGRGMPGKRRRRKRGPHGGRASAPRPDAGGDGRIGGGMGRRRRGTGRARTAARVRAKSRPGRGFGRSTRRRRRLATVGRGGGWPRPRRLFWPGDAEHAAERAQQALDAGGGVEQGDHVRLAQQMLELRGVGAGRRHRLAQPAGAPRQAARRGDRRPAGQRLAGGSARGGAQPAGGGAGGEAGDAQGHPFQPRPQQQQDGDGEKPARRACRGGLAHIIDDAGEAFGRRQGGFGVHERNKNTDAPAWASAINPAVL